MRLFVVMTLCCVPLIVGCDESPAPVELSGTTMGTQYHISIAQPSEDLDIDALQSEIDAELQRINAQMSTYLPDSEISEFNSQDGVLWIGASVEFVTVVQRAKRFSEETAGAFDVTVAPLVDCWNFGPGKASLDLPSDAEVAKLKQAVGFQLIDVRDQPPALKKQRPDVQIDLSAIAKGFAVDRITQLLESRGLRDCMAEIGGEICVRGSKAGAAAWTVGIERPVTEARVVQRVIHLRDAALATSGDYRNFIEIDGRRYSHIIDPRTGYPVDHRLASVSVIAEDCLSADAWATGLLVLGPERGYELAQQLAIPALMIERTDAGFVERATPEFEKIVNAAQTADSGTGDDGVWPGVGVFFFTLVAFATAMVAMATGVIISRRRLTGSCGGAAGLRDAAGRPLCEVCSNPSETCRSEDHPSQC